MMGAPFTAAGQTPVRLQQLEVAFWPEYDREDVLVIQRGLLAEEVQLPVTIRFQVPKSMTHLGGTAGIDESGAFRYFQPSVVDQGEYIEVTYTTPYRTFQFEYYDGQLQIEGDTRTYSPTIVVPYEVAFLVLEAQEPTGSEAYTTEPPGTQTADPLGSNLAVRRLELGAAQGNDAVTWNISYTKSDDRLSAEVLGLPTPGVSTFEDASPSGGDGLQTGLIIAVVVLAILFMGALGYVLGTRRQAAAVPPPPPPRRGKRKKPRPRPSRKAGPKRPKAQAASQQAFCHECGNALAANDLFCASCGTRRKGR
jgi:hypothetical protein